LDEVARAERDAGGRVRQRTLAERLRPNRTCRPWAQAIGRQIEVLGLSTEAEIDAAFATLVEARAEALNSPRGIPAKPMADASAP
jgi:hypothetical protein